MKYIIIALFGLSLFITTSCKKTCKENPVNDCYCSEEYSPVCGCNDKTYSNACEAHCAGVDDYKEGSCEDQQTNT